MKMTDLTTADDGNYTCVVENKFGQISWEFNLDVVGKWRSKATFYL